MKNQIILRFLFVSALVFTFSLLIQAQTTKITYQGNLNDNSQPADGNYDFEFALFGVQIGGNQIGNTISISNVAVVDGNFTVELDFGTLFASTDRFLEIRVRQTNGIASSRLGAGEFTTLSPRQLVTSSPYAIKSLSADSALTALDANRALDSSRLGGIPAGQFIREGDPRLTDARTPLPGNTNYIQNSTSQQATSNFNISGNGTADKFDALTQYNLNGSRVLSVIGTNNFFVGIGSGENNTTGNNNSFFGNSAGLFNTEGSLNSFFGHGAGQLNTTGGSNAFFGRFTGFNNTTGDANSFFGASAGNEITIGSFNSFFGRSSGATTTTGNFNSFFGWGAGITNTTGEGNTLIGTQTDVGSSNLTNTTAIGFRAQVDMSNSLVLGSINGINDAIADTNVGIGTTSPTERLHIAINNGQILIGDAGCPSGNTGIGFGSTLSGCSNYSIRGNGSGTYINRPSGGAIFFRENNITQFRINSGGTVTVNILGSAGSTSVCRNSSNDLATCSSSIRYKSNIENFDSGLELIKKLRPVSFNWTEGGMLDVGLVAEEVEKVEPLLTTPNKSGQVEGVKYDRIGVVLINAVKEQQTQIEILTEKLEKQQEIIVKQRSEIDQLKNKKSEFEELKQLVCLQNPTASFCTSKEKGEK